MIINKHINIQTNICIYFKSTPKPFMFYGQFYNILWVFLYIIGSHKKKTCIWMEGKTLTESKFIVVVSAAVAAKSSRSSSCC